LIKRGEIYFADLNPVVGNEQGGLRPVLIIQNDAGNQHSPTTIIAPLTTKDKQMLPTHVPVVCNGTNNVILLEQIRAISRARLFARFGALSPEDMQKVDKTLLVSLGLSDGMEYIKRENPLADNSVAIHKPRRPRRRRH